MELIPGPPFLVFAGQVANHFVAAGDGLAGVVVDDSRRLIAVRYFDIKVEDRDNTQRGH